MITLFWVGIMWLGYVFLGYPLFLAVLAIIRRVQANGRDDYLPTVSVLISARNEEKDIGWKVTETLGWDYPPDKLEVLVASDASDDRTDQIVKGIRDPRVKLVRLERRSGKGIALNKLAQIARGDLLFFTDANANIQARSVRWIVRHFADERVGCVTGETHTGQQKEAPVVESGASVYGGYESTMKRLESAIGSVLVCDGAIFCIRRSLFRPVLPVLANDLELPLRIGQAGYWVLHEPRAVVLERDTSSPLESFAQRRRISAQGLLGMWKLRTTLGVLRGWQFVSRKFLRWLILIPMGLIFMSSAYLSHQPLIRVFFAVQILFYVLAFVGFLLALNGRSAGRILSVPFYVLLGSCSTLVGVADALIGRRFEVWETPTLSRGREQESYGRIN